ncbi:hypothetical protein [Sulfitobacter mediterraneus]|uniref:hypothetical protein n=1 Tax=Sulfitobacter mediterraneus TaxID=83219 RepID=UPI002491F43A|nr:hypothetical protein [Sulfitobacter mediterraneus]
MKFYVFPGAAALALGACTNEPTPLPNITAQQAVANTAIASPISYQDPLAGYTYRGPTGPRDWRSVNEEQTEGN